MNGVLVIDKPEGFTSFDVIAVVRKLTGQRKTGHTGTLDPNATGVLPVLLGSATKAQDILPDHDKGYTAGFQLGIRTDTLDIWGEVLERVQTDASEEEVLRAMESFRGDIMQVPPMYSAIKKNGQRLYDLARQGVEVEREARPVTVYRLRGHLCPLAHRRSRQKARSLRRYDLSQTHTRLRLRAAGLRHPRRAQRADRERQNR